MPNQDSNKTKLITHKIKGVKVHVRSEDGYCNATAMCKAAGKKTHDYRRLSETQSYINVVSAETGIPASELIQSLRGGNQGQGTWVHPDIALHLAQWLDAEVAYAVTKIVKSWMAGDVQESQQQSLPALSPQLPITHTVITYMPDGTRAVKNYNGKIVINALSDVLVASKEQERLKLMAREKVMELSAIFTGFILAGDVLPSVDAVGLESI